MMNETTKNTTATNETDGGQTVEQLQARVAKLEADEKRADAFETQLAYTDAFLRAMSASLIALAQRFDGEDMDVMMGYAQAFEDRADVIYSKMLG